ncbi:unnamed protein product [Leuciscus chuanchicus]
MIINKPVSSLRVYERYFLLSLQESAVVASSCYSAVDLCGLSGCCRKRRKRNRRRGKRGGVLVEQRRAHAFAAGPAGHVGSLMDVIDSSCTSSCQQDASGICAFTHGGSSRLLLFTVPTKLVWVDHFQHHTVSKSLTWPPRLVFAQIRRTVYHIFDVDIRSKPEFDSEFVRRQQSLEVRYKTQRQRFASCGIFDKDCNPEEAERGISETTLRLFVIRKEGAGAEDEPEDVGVVIEGVQRLQPLMSVSFGLVMRFGLIYALKLPSESQIHV